MTSSDSGCMRVIPGSQTRGQLPHEQTFHKDSLLRRGQRITAPIDEDRAAEVRLDAGEMSLHCTRIVHGSRANASNDWRLACGMNFLPTRVRHAERRESALLVRGRDRYGYFDSEPRPESDLGPAACEAYRTALEKMGRRRAR